MKVLELLDELDEIIEVASSVPVVRKVMVDPNEVTEIVKEVHALGGSIEGLVPDPILKRMDEKLRSGR